MKNKILLGMPCMGSIPYETVQCLTQTRNCDIHLEALSLVDIARERICDLAIANKYEYLLFVDSDMVWTNRHIEKLLAADKEIVTGLAFMRKPPYFPCVFKTMRLGEAGEKLEKLLDETMWEDGLQEIEGCGLAFCLIRVEALKDIRKYNTTLFRQFAGYGEDLSFAIRARRAKHKLWCDPSVTIGHLTTEIVLPEHYLAWKEGHNA